MNNTRSKVFTLGNKLTKTLPRPLAFSRAWELVKAGKYEAKIKGVTFGNRQEALRRLSSYNPSLIRAFLVPEYDNPIDHNAISVMVGVQNGKGLYKLGYVPAEDTGIISALQKKSTRINILKGDIYGARMIIGA